MAPKQFNESTCRPAVSVQSLACHPAHTCLYVFAIAAWSALLCGSASTVPQWLQSLCGHSSAPAAASEQIVVQYPDHDADNPSVAPLCQCASVEDFGHK
jgi:hypothetical protein